MKLTKTFIDKLVYGKEGNRPHIVFDDEVKGFAVRVYPSGEKSFLVDYRVGGKQRRMVLGRYGTLTLDQARRLARQRLTDVCAGNDPLKAKLEARTGETMQQVCHHYLEEYSKKHKRSWAEDERRFNIHIVPALGLKRVKDVTRKDIAAFHNTLGSCHPYEANRCLALLSTVFEHAKRNGYLPEGQPNPAKGIKKFPEQKRDRWLQGDEISRLLAAIETHENVYIRSALALYLFTGLRKNELLRARWNDLNLDRGELRIPETKNNRVHIVPLSKPALEILRSIPRQEGNEFIFCGRKAGTHLINIDKSWGVIRKKTGLNDVRIHDLRRTLGSMLVSSGVSVQIVQKLLNHRDLSTTSSVYAHLSNNPLKQAMEAHGENIIDFTRLQVREEGKAS